MPGTDDVVDAYLGQMATVLQSVLGDNLEAVWMGGSLVTGDFRASASDVDVLVACRRALSPSERDSLAGALSHSELPCPAHGLDLLVYRGAGIRSVPRSPWYEFSIATGRFWDDDVSQGGDYPGGILDLALVRARGVALKGPQPEAIVGPTPHSWIMEELAGSLHWHTARVHDPFHDPTGSNAVLNACRALYYRSERSFVSKSQGARWYLASHDVPVVTSALAGRIDEAPTTLSRANVLSFVAEAIEEFLL